MREIDDRHKSEVQGRREKIQKGGESAEREKRVRKRDGS